MLRLSFTNFYFVFLKPLFSVKQLVLEVWGCVNRILLTRMLCRLQMYRCLSIQLIIFLSSLHWFNWMLLPTLHWNDRASQSKSRRILMVLGCLPLILLLQQKRSPTFSPLYNALDPIKTICIHWTPTSTIQYLY